MRFASSIAVKILAGAEEWENQRQRDNLQRQQQNNKLSSNRIPLNKEATVMKR